MRSYVKSIGNWIITLWYISCLIKKISRHPFILIWHSFIIEVDFVIMETWCSNMFLCLHVPTAFWWVQQSVIFLFSWYRLYDVIAEICSFHHIFTLRYILYFILSAEKFVCFLLKIIEIWKGMIFIKLKLNLFYRKFHDKRMLNFFITVLNMT